MKLLQILVLILGMSIIGNAQKAVLSGTVYDYLGAVIPYGKIKAIDSEGKIFSTSTNEDGKYELNLPEGAYQIEVTFLTFNKFIVSDYWISYKMQLDVALQCKNDCKIIVDPIIFSEKSLDKLPRKRKLKGIINNEQFNIWNY